MMGAEIQLANDQFEQDTQPLDKDAAAARKDGIRMNTSGRSVFIEIATHSKGIRPPWRQDQ